MITRLTSILFLFFSLAVSGQSDRFLDSLIMQGEYFYLLDPDSALSCFTHALEQATSVGNKEYMVRAAAELANQHFHNGDYSIAKPQFLRLLEDEPEKEYPVEASLATLRLGHMCDETGDPDSALHFYLRTIAIDE